MNFLEDRSEELNMKTFEKIVLITTQEYSVYFEKFINSQVSVIWAKGGNLSDVASAIKCRKKLEPVKTLWLTHTELFQTDQTEKSNLCALCKEPLKIKTVPSTQRLAYYQHVCKVRSSLDKLIKEVNSFLDADSSFAILPPFPPTFFPLKDVEHDLYHKIDQGRKTYYFTTSSALREFELLYFELRKQIIPFFLAELKKMTITSKSIADYFRVTDSWSSYLHIETNTVELQIEEYSNTKYNQWFDHINKFLLDVLNSSCGETIHLKSRGEKENALKDYISSEIRDDLSDILNYLDHVTNIDENLKPDIINLESPTTSPKTEESVNSENYEHIVFICFSQAHAQLIPRDQEFAKRTSVVVVNSTLNFCEEEGKFAFFTQVYETLLFIIIGSINLLRKEYPEPFCKSIQCDNPLICLNLGLDSYDEITNKVIEKYKLFIGNMRKYFENLSASFILTPIVPLKLTPKPHIANKSSHRDLHKVLVHTNTYLTIEGISRWSALANAFQKCYYSRIFKECHTRFEIKTVVNVLKEIKYTSKPISWVELSESTIIVDADYDEDDLKLFLKKFVDVSCSYIEHKRKNLQCSTSQSMKNTSENSFSLHVEPSIKQEEYYSPNIPVDGNEDNTNLQKEGKRPNDKRKANHFFIEDISDLTRSMEEEIMTSTESQIKVEYSKDDEICSIGILLDADFIANVREMAFRLKKDSNCNISIEFKSFSGTDKCVCSITGTLDSVLEVLYLIIEIVNTWYGKQIEFVVPDSIAGLIVGEKGENQQRIMIKSKAHLQLYKKEKYPSPNESCFVISSSNVTNIKAALSLILEYIVSFGNATCSNLANSDVSLPASKLDKASNIKGVNEEMMVPEPTIENVEENKVCHFKILLSNEVIEALIGDNGEALQNLQKDTNSKITISKNFEYFPGSERRVCLITGTVDVVFKVLFSIIDIIKNVNLEKFNRYVEFVVPDSTAKLIIGEKEQNLHQIKAKSQAYVRMYRKENYPSPNESCFVVKDFHMGNISTAFSMILSKIALDPENGSFSDITYQQFSPAFNPNEVPHIEDLLPSAKNENVDSGTTAQLTPENHKKDNTCHLKILLKSDFAEPVIGIIQKLQEDTNSKVNISKEFEYFPGTDKRVCSIAGTIHSVLKALFSIMDFTECSPFIVGYEMQVEFVVPVSTANIINDPRQINMRQVMTESKAFLRMYNNRNNFIETVFMVRSIGEEFVRAAFSLLVEYVILDPENGTCIHAIYPNVNDLAPKKTKLLSSVKKIMDLPTHLLVLNRSRANKICDLKILLKNLECEALIGDKGETLEKLKTYSNSTVTISKELEYFPGTNERICHIAGAAKAVFKALLFIIDIKNGNTPFGSEGKMVLILPGSTAKSLIGNEEAIKNQSKAYIRRYNKKDYSSPTEACFVVRSFDIEFIRTAFVLIIDCITSNSGNDACPSLSNPNAKLPETANIDLSHNIKWKETVDSEPLLVLDKSKEDKICSVKILLEKEISDEVFGDNGDTLKKLQKISRFMKIISRESESFPGAPEYVYSIAGVTRYVLKALFYMIDIKKGKTPRGTEVQIKFVVPDSTARLIIGDNEENIQQIRRKSKAYMRMYNKKNYPSPTDTCFIVRSYDVEFIRTAIILILGCIMPNSENGSCGNVPKPYVDSSYQSLKTVPKIKDSKNGSCIGVSNPNVSVPISNPNVAPIRKDSSLGMKKIVNSEIPPQVLDNSKASKNCHLKILLESYACEAVFGINGEDFKKLQKDLRFMRIISKEFEYYQGTIFSLTGTASDVLSALMYIINVKKIKVPRGSEVQIKLIVSHSTARLIIGRKQKNLRRIKTKSKADFRMYNNIEFPSYNDACFLVKSYNIGFIRAALIMTLESIIPNSEIGSCSNVSRSTVNLPTSSSNNAFESKDLTLGMEEEIEIVFEKAPQNKIHNETIRSKTPQIMPECPDKNKIFYLKILLEGELTDAVDEDPEETLQKLQKDTNSTVTISKEFEKCPDSCERVYLIAGTVAAVLKAFFFIIDSKAKVLRGFDVQVELVVPDSTAKLIVGENEENIQQIIMKSKTFMRPSRKRDFLSLNESCFLVWSNNVQFIKTAFSLILKYIVLDPESGSHNIVSSPVGSLPVPKSNEAPGNIDATIAISSSTTKSQEIHSQSSGDLATPSEVKEISDYKLRSEAAGGYPASEMSSRSPSYDSSSEHHSSDDSGQRYRNRSPSPYRHKYRNRSRNWRSQSRRSRSISPKRKWSAYSARKRSRSRTNSVEYHSSSRKRSLKSSRSRSRNYRKRRRWYSRSRSRTNSVEYQSSPRKTSLKSSRSRSRNYRKLRRWYSRSRSRTNSVEYQSSPRKTSLKSSRSRSRNYRKRRRWYSRSRSRTNSVEYQSSSRKTSLKSSRSRSRNYRKRRRWYSRSRSRTESRSSSRDREHGSRSDKNSPSRTDNNIHRDSNKIGDKFSLNGTLVLLERVRNKCGVLNGMIKAFTTAVKSELAVDESKAMRLIEDDDNIQLLRLTINKLESCIASASLEEIGMLSKAMEWTTTLIEHVEKVKTPEININLKAIAQVSLNKTPDFIFGLIKTAFLYEGYSNPTEEDINKAFVKVSELQFQIVMSKKCTNSDE